MFKKLILAGAIALGPLGGYAISQIVQQPANVGVAPTNGTNFALPDNRWLLGVAAGYNFSFQSGIVAHAGGTQAAAFQLPSQIYLIEVDTVTTTGDSVLLPQCFAGSSFLLRNAGAGTLDVYGNTTVNPKTAAADTINGTAGSSAYTLGNNTNATFFCAKNGNWSAVKGS